MKSDAPGARWLRWGWAAAALAAFALYLPSLRYEFVYDDIPIVRENYRIRDLGLAGRYLGTSYWNRPGQNKEYRPATMASYALNYAIAGPRPFSFHLVNSLLHAAVSAALWWLAWLLFRRAGLATCAAILFAVHPVHVECVSGIVGRAELLSSLGFVAALLAALTSYRSRGPAGRWGWACAAGLAAALAFCSKENTVTLLPLILVLPLAARRESGDERKAEAPRWDWVARLLPVLALTGFALIGYAAARYAVLGGFFSRPGEMSIFPYDNPMVTLEGAPRLAWGVRMLGRYGLMLVAPFHPSPDYSWGAITLVVRVFDPVWIALPVILPLAVWLVWTLRRRPASLFGLAFVAITFAITSNIFFLIGTMLAERLLYLPSMGFCLLAADLALWAGEGLHRGFKTEGMRLGRGGAAALVALAGLWSIALAAQTMRYLPKWKSNFTLYEYMVDRVPGSARARMLIGQEYLNRGRIEEGTVHLEKSVEIVPEIPIAMASLGGAYKLAGRMEDARRMWEATLAVDPNEPEAILELARVYALAGDRERAEKLYPLALAAAPGDYRLRRDYGLLLEVNSKWREAIEQLSRIAPREGSREADEAVFTALGRAHLRLGENARAADFFDRALRVNPGNSRAALGRVTALTRLGRLDEAERRARDLIGREPGNQNALRAMEAIEAGRTEVFSNPELPLRSPVDGRM